MLTLDSDIVSKFKLVSINSSLDEPKNIDVGDTVPMSVYIYSLLISLDNVNLIYSNLCNDKENFQKREMELIESLKLLDDSSLKSLYVLVSLILYKNSELTDESIYFPENGLVKYLRESFECSDFKSIDEKKHDGFIEFQPGDTVLNALMDLAKERKILLENNISLDDCLNKLQNDDSLLLIQKLRLIENLKSFLKFVYVHDNQSSEKINTLIEKFKNNALKDFCNILEKEDCLKNSVNYECDWDDVLGKDIKHESKVVFEIFDLYMQNNSKTNGFNIIFSALLSFKSVWKKEFSEYLSKDIFNNYILKSDFLTNNDKLIKISINLRAFEKIKILKAYDNLFYQNVFQEIHGEVCEIFYDNNYGMSKQEITDYTSYQVSNMYPDYEFYIYKLLDEVMFSGFNCQIDTSITDVTTLEKIEITCDKSLESMLKEMMLLPLTNSISDSQKKYRNLISEFVNKKQLETENIEKKQAEIQKKEAVLKEKQEANLKVFQKEVEEISIVLKKMNIGYFN